MMVLVSIINWFYLVKLKLYKLNDKLNTNWSLNISKNLLIIFEIHKLKQIFHILINWKIQIKITFHEFT